MKSKNVLGLDKSGAQKVMYKSDYIGDMAGMFGLSLMGNVVSQLNYFYTDKVGVAVGSIGVAFLVAKIIDALTDLFFGNLIDRSKGGNLKYLKWMRALALPAGVMMPLMFTVPKGNMSIAYILLTNVLLSAVIYTCISTPYTALMVVRTKSQEERSTMGLLRALGSYFAGMVMAILTIPITNMLGGDQAAWIKYGLALGVLVFVNIFISYWSARKAPFIHEEAAIAQDEENKQPLGTIVKRLFKNKYWVIVLLFNLLIQINYTITGSAGTYYMKWIFGNDNLVATVGALSMIPTVLGFIFSKPIINKLGVRNTIHFSLILGIVSGIIKCLFPTHFVINVTSGLVSTFASIPILSLFGVLTAMAVDYNDYLYNDKMVAVSGGATGFGNKVGGGLGSVLLSAILAWGGYDASLAVATESMRTSIFVFANYLPVIIFVILLLLFQPFDIEKRMPVIQAALAERDSKLQK